MKSSVFITAALTISLLGCGQGASSSGSAQQDDSVLRVEPDLDATPLDIVNRRMSAYNRHDLGAFMDLYADGIEIFNYPNRSLGGGRDHLRSIFEPMFQEGAIQVEIHHQIAKDSYVVNHETVTYGDTTTEYVSIYEVRGGLIRSVRFVRD